MNVREEFEAWARKHDSQAHVLRFVVNRPLTDALPESWRIYEAAYRAGAEDMRELAANVCEPQEQHDDPLTAWKIAAAIRALATSPSQSG